MSAAKLETVLLGLIGLTTAFFFSRSNEMSMKLGLSVFNLSVILY